MRNARSTWKLVPPTALIRPCARITVEEQASLGFAFRRSSKIARRKPAEGIRERKREIWNWGKKIASGWYFCTVLCNLGGGEYDELYRCDLFDSCTFYYVRVLKILWKYWIVFLILFNWILIVAKELIDYFFFLIYICLIGDRARACVCTRILVFLIVVTKWSWKCLCQLVNFQSYCLWKVVKSDNML